MAEEKEKVLEHLAKPDEDKFAIDPDHMPSTEEIAKENLLKITRNIRQIMFMKRGMEGMGVDAGDIAFAIMDYARECDERFQSMPEEELDEMIFNRLLEALLGDRIEDKIDPETAA